MTYAEKPWPGTVIRVAGLAGLYLFAFFAFLGIAGGFIGLALMLLAFLLALPQVWPRLRSDRVFWLFAAFSVYVLIRAGHALAEFPGSEQYGLAFDWLYLGAFVVVAWWLGARMNRLAAVLALALAGLLVGVARSQAWSDVIALLAGARSGFGRGIPQMGLFSAAAVVGVVALAPRLWGPLHARPRFWLRLLSWVLVLAALVEVLIVSQSRISWIAVLLVLPVVLTLQARTWLKAHPLTPRTRAAWLAGLGLLLLSGLVLANFNIIKQRSLAELDTMEAIAEGHSGEVPLTPLGIRFHLVGLGVEQWLKRPLFGWGPGTQVAELAPEPLRQFGHVHNTYLEMLARFGVVGVLLVAAGTYLNLRSLLQARRDGRLPLDYLLAIVGGFAVLAIWSSANFRLSADWRFFWILFNALAYTFRLHHAVAPVPAARTATVRAAPSS